MKKQAQAPHSNTVDYGPLSPGPSRPQGNPAPATSTGRSQVSELTYALKAVIRALQSGEQEKAQRLWEANKDAFVAEVNNALDPKSMIGSQDKELVNTTIPKTWIKTASKIAKLASVFETKYFGKKKVI
jgi:hypothetical protein